MDSRGLTLPELLLVLLLAGVAVQLLITPIRRQSDALVLLGVREEVVALIHQARMEARLRGAAWVRIGEGSDPVLLVPAMEGEGEDGGGSGSEDGGVSVRLRVPLASRGVELEILGDRDDAELRYGPLGVAYFAGTTMVLRRGDRESHLVVSSYGRVRR